MRTSLHFTLIFLAFSFITPANAKQKFESSAVVQVHPSVLAIQSGKNPGQLLTRNYMENEFETIVASETLKIAATLLKIDLEKNKDAITTLKKKISTHPRRGTDFIEIKVQDTDKKEAVRIANAVASAYIKRRTDAEATRAKNALAALDEELKAQSEMVTLHRNQLTELIQKHGIPHLDGAFAPSGGPMLVPAPETALKILKEAKPEDKLAVAAAIHLPKNPVTPLYNDYHKSLEKLDYLSQAYGPKHPKIIGARKAVNEARNKANKAIGQLPALLQKQMSVPRVTIPQPRGNDSVALSLRQHRYNQAKETYEQSRAMLREMKIKQQEARILLKMPRSPVTLHQKAG